VAGRLSARFVHEGDLWGSGVSFSLMINLPFAGREWNCSSRSLMMTDMLPTDLFSADRLDAGQFDEGAGLWTEGWAKVRNRTASYSAAGVVSTRSLPPGTGKWRAVYAGDDEFNR
jgi:hypothetical protein